MINSKSKGKRGELSEEIWKDIEGYENLYQISNKGNVKNIRTGKLLSAEKSNYLSVYLYKNGYKHFYKIHRLLAKAFIPNPENKPYINHIDGNKFNNNIENLEWCTAKENALHAVKTGLFDLKGLKQANKNKQIKVIKHSDKTIYESINECARKNNVQAFHIWRVCKGFRKCCKGEQYSFYYD